MAPDTRQCVRQLQISAAVGKQCAHFCDIVQIPPAARAALCSVCVFVRLRGMRVYLCDVVQDSPAARRCATRAYLCDVVQDSSAARRCVTRAYLCHVVQNCPTTPSMQSQAIMSLLGCSWRWSKGTLELTTRFANEHTQLISDITASS